MSVKNHLQSISDRTHSLMPPSLTTSTIFFIVLLLQQRMLDFIQSTAAVIIAKAISSSTLHWTRFRLMLLPDNSKPSLKLHRLIEIIFKRKISEILGSFEFESFSTSQCGLLSYCSTPALVHMSDATVVALFLDIKPSSCFINSYHYFCSFSYYFRVNSFPLEQNSADQSDQSAKSISNASSGRQSFSISFLRIIRFSALP